MRDLAAFPWFEAPPREALAAADHALWELGALRDDGGLSPLGERLVVTGADLGDPARAAALAALLAEGAASAGEPLEAQLERLHGRVQRVARDLERLVGPATARRAEVDLGALALAAFPDRVARRRGPGSEQALMVGGRGLTLPERALAPSEELFVALDAGFGTRDRQEARVRLAVPLGQLQRAWPPTWPAGRWPGSSS